jgi:hypothetical protein
VQGGWYRTLVASNEALAGLLQTLAALEAGEPAASEAWTHAGLARCGGRCVPCGGRADWDLLMWRLFWPINTET